MGYFPLAEEITLPLPAPATLALMGMAHAPVVPSPARVELVTALPPGIAARLFPYVLLPAGLAEIAKIAREGQKLLCFIPESGRFSIAYMLLTVV